MVALGKGGTNIPVGTALDHVFGYGLALDITRRDLQQRAKAARLPWEIGKAFEGSAPCTPLRPASVIGHPSRGAISLDINGERRQSGDLNQMIWKVPEIIAYLSGVSTLKAGDVILTGTPAGATPFYNATATGKEQEECPLHAAHLHQPKHPAVVDPAEMVDDGLSVVDHGRAALPPEGDGLQAGRGTVGTEKSATSGKGHADRSTPCEGRPT